MKRNNNLRLGLMCQENTLAQWQYDAIKYLTSDPRISLELLILDTTDNYDGGSLFNKLKRLKFSSLFFLIYSKFILKPKSLKRTSIKNIFERTTKIKCKVIYKNKYSQHFSENDIQQIKSKQLDFILRFGFNIIRGEILKSAKYGVWSFHHGDEQKYRGGPPCFWEIFYRDCETGSILQKLNERLDGGIILRKGIFRSKDFSYAANIDQAYFESAKWPLWACLDILNGDDALYLSENAVKTSAPIYKIPNNSQFIKFSTIIIFNFLKKVFERFFYVQIWNVQIIRLQTPDELGKNKAEVLFTMPLINSYSFNADCFASHIEDKIYIFYEELNYKTKQAQGRINVAELNLRDTNSIKISEVTGLPKGIHLSYPFLFKNDDGEFLIPESGEDKSITLYQSEEFPNKWKERCKLLEGEKFVDPTLFYFEDKYWLFYTLTNKMANGEMHLHIAYSNSLNEAFIEHPKNPVKISAKSTRGAGAFYVKKDGTIMRPSQNFTKSYGGSIILNKVTKLSTTDYAEQEIAELYSTDNEFKDGLHTINHIHGDWWVIDVKKNAFKWNKLFV